MNVDFVRWPESLAQRYRERGHWLDQPLTRILDQQCRERPDALALICGERQFTYAEIDRLASNLAAHLSALGLGHGDTALVQLPNVAEFHIVFFALLKIGVAPVNALYSHRRLEMSAYARQIQPRLLIAARRHELFSDETFMGELRSISPALAQVLLLGETSPDTSLDLWLAEGGAPSHGGTPTRADEVAFFQLSGGSTGTPKLIPRTHNDYDYSVRASAEICRLSPQTRFLCALPAGHNYVLSSPGTLGVFHAGGCVVMAPNPEALGCFALIERHGIDMAALVPSAVALWLQVVPGHEAALRSLRLIQVGGASFAEALARQVPEKLGCALQQVFGMAEGLVNYTRLDDADELVFTTQGRPISPDDEVKVVDEEGRDVPDGETGMLATRGPYTFRGYYRSPEHNEKVFDVDGFYYSGDLVQRSAQGYLRVVGRIKDQINRGGEKIASEEVENLLLLHPEVMQAALVAMSDPLLGEKSCAFLVARKPGLPPSALRQHLIAQGVAEYKLPDRFRFIDTMPLTPVGKIDKNRLRQQLQNPPVSLST
ncbi:(2,3-dihydroxybenzoyl)adenylate synthase [Labrys neptuniae]|uniref:(2,3-dihydroxybenzoyl)adenylate synthase n=1 Tax=Labrys neptuniae TaxID=376174 RepID=UPI0028925367|nr:(2,3-dihydroxybenzoyl)adenylate synthase [Labrys neptuniae]MDT3380494.1 (2,3-dihydroxybenzoyl)adenylate synthase [Labrys neptuniae]